MRIKFQEIKANYDYVIVGSGIVGMTILQELIERKKNKILVLDSGSMLSSNPYPDFMTVKSKKFKIKTKSYFNGVGGASNVWGSNCGIYDKDTITKYFNIKQFPLNHYNYKKYINKAKKYGFPLYEQFNDEVKVNNKLKTKKIIKVTPNIKYSSLSSILESTKVDFLENSMVSKIQDGKVFFSFSKEKKILSVFGKKIILAANTVGNFNILNNSNLNLNLKYFGKGFMNHPKGVIGTVKYTPKFDLFLKKNKINSSSYLGFQLKQSKYKHYLNISKGFKLPILHYWITYLEGNTSYYRGVFNNTSKIFNQIIFRILLFKLKIINRILNKIFSNYCFIQAFTETAYRFENYIKYDPKENKTIIDYDLSSSELDTMFKLIYEFEDFFEIKISFKPNSIKKLKKLISLDASHHMGGIICGSNSNNSVVDLNLKVHGTEGVYVCGGAVFPFAGVVNPTMSYVALAIWLSNEVL